MDIKKRLKECESRNILQLKRRFEHSLSLSPGPHSTESCSSNMLHKVTRSKTKGRLPYKKPAQHDKPKRKLLSCARSPRVSPLVLKSTGKTSGKNSWKIVDNRPLQYDEPYGYNPAIHFMEHNEQREIAVPIYQTSDFAFKTTNGFNGQFYENYEKTKVMNGTVTQVDRNFQYPIQDFEIPMVFAHEQYPVQLNEENNFFTQAYDVYIDHTLDALPDLCTNSLYFYSKSVSSDPNHPLYAECKMYEKLLRMVSGSKNFM